MSLLSSLSLGGGHDAYHEPISKPDIHEINAWLQVASYDGYLDVIFSTVCLLNAIASHSRNCALVAVATLQGGVAVKLAVRRVVRSAVTCPAAVCSVCVLLPSKEEYAPPGYRVICKVRHNQGVLCNHVHYEDDVYLYGFSKTFNSARDRVGCKDRVFGVSIPSTPWNTEYLR